MHKQHAESIAKHYFVAEFRKCKDFPTAPTARGAMTINFNMAFRPFAVALLVPVVLAGTVSVTSLTALAQTRPAAQPSQPALTAPAAPGPASDAAVMPQPPSSAPAKGARAAQRAQAPTGPLQLTDDAPSSYVVKKGDTLWSIAARFLKNPWRWNDLWRMNQDQIRNPHRIHPGDVLVLGKGNDAQPQLTMEPREPERPTIRFSPQVKVTPIDNDAIPTIPPSIIDPFLIKPLVIDRDGLENAAKIVGSADTRVVLAPGYKIYAVGIEQDQGNRWQIYRPGRALSSPGKPEVLGYEAVYLGDANVEKFGEVSTLKILSATQEIVIGDRLIKVPPERIINYPPHSPERDVSGRVIAMPSTLVESGRDAVIALDVGSREGIEIGHVLALLHSPGTVDVWDQKNPYTFQPDKRTLALPDERIGLVFVFRVFDRVSYALVLNTTKQVEIGDWVRKP